MADETKNVTTVFRADVSQFKKNIADATSSIKLANATFDASTAHMEDWSKTTEGLEAKIEQLSATIKAQEKIQENYRAQLEAVREAKEKNVKQAEELRKKLEEMAKSGKEGTSEFKSYAKQLANLEKEIEKSEKAEKGLTIEMKKSEAAAGKAKKQMDGYGDELKEVEKAADGVDDTMEDIAEGVEEAAEAAEDASDGFTVLKGALANLASEAALKGLDLIAKAGHAIADGFKQAVVAADNLNAATNDFSAATGIDTEANPEYQKAIQNVYADNFGEDYADIAESMAIIKQTTNEIDPTALEGLTRNALILRDTFDMDVQEQMRAVDMLMTQFGISSDEAFNLLAQGAQNGLNKNGDLLDTINEYSVHYKQLGYTADEFFNSLANGTEAGTFSVDKLGDAMKEFGIRVKDTSKSTQEGLALIGYSTEHQVANIQERFAAGGETAKAAMAEVVTALMAIDDPIQQNAAGVALFGTMWEDLGVEGIKALTNVEGAISTTADAMQQISEVKYDNLSDAWEGLGRIIETNVSIPIGQGALPIISDFVNALSSGMKEANGDVGAMASAVGDALSGLVDGFAEYIPQVTEAAVEFIPAFIQGLVPSLPKMVQAAGDIVFALVDGLLAAIPELAPAAMTIVISLVMGLINHIPDLVEGALQLLMAIIDAIPLLIEQLAPQIPVIVEAIITSLMAAIPTLLQGAVTLLLAIVNAIPLIIPPLIRALPTIIQSIISALIASIPVLIDGALALLNALVQAIPLIIPAIIEALPQIIEALIYGLIEATPLLVEGAFQLLFGIIDAIPMIVGELIVALPQIITTIIETLLGAIPDLLAAGGDLISGLIDGMLGSVSRLGDAIANIGSSVVDGLKGFFGIHSPSRLLRDEIGKMLPPGIAIGVEANADEAIDSMKHLGDEMVKSIDVSGVADKLNVITEGLTTGTLKVAAETSTVQPKDEGTTNNSTNNKTVNFSPTYHYNKPLNAKEVYRNDKKMLRKIVGVET